MGRIEDELINLEWWDGRSVLDRIYTKVRGNALWVWGPVGGFGLLAVLMDSDHVLSGLARQTHIPITVVLGIICIGAVAYNYRLFGKLVLDHEDRTSICIKDDVHYKIVERKEKIIDE